MAYYCVIGHDYGLLLCYRTWLWLTVVLWDMIMAYHCAIGHGYGLLLCHRTWLWLTVVS